MKQTYVKPTMMIERFGLTQSIAASCTAGGGNTLGKPTNWNKEVCGWEIQSGLVLFVDAVTACTFDVDPDGRFFDLCYNNPEGAMVFSSY